MPSSDSWVDRVRDGLREIDAARLPAPGRTVGRYEILDVLGRGAMGVVYRARDRELDRVVALKILKEGDAASRVQLERFHREATLAARLRHPNIVAVHEVGESGDVRFIAMDCIAGVTLAGTIPTWRGRWRELAALVEKIARAVHFAHENGIVHRDLKPGNILLDDRGVPVVTDFGLAKEIESGTSFTQTGAALGTPVYMSPEQVRGESKRIGPASDVYALGVILYEMSAGSPPFAGATPAELFHKILFADPPARADVPRDLETIAMRAMSKEPERRYGSAGALADDLRRFVQGEPIVARPLSAAGRVVRYLRRRPWALATLAVLLLGLATTSGILWQNARRQARLERANARVDEAARKVEEWDRLIYLPPRDLTPHRELLRAAVDLCEGVPLPAARYQTARALSRLGEDEKAERTLREVADGGARLELARLLLRRLTRRMMEESQLTSLQWALGGGRVAQEQGQRIQRELVRDIARELGEARRLGCRTEFERQYAEAVGRALDEDLDAAERLCAELLDRCSVWEQAEIRRLLAWVEFARHLGGFRAGAPGVRGFRPSERLAAALEHLSAALELRRGDAELYLFRARLHLTSADEPLSSLMRDADRPSDLQQLRDGPAEERARIEEHRRGAYARAREDVETVLKIRPKDADGLLLLALCEIAALPLSTWLAIPESAGEGDPAAIKRIMEGMAPLLAALGRAEAHCDAALAAAPDHTMAWAQLSMIRLARAVPELLEKKSDGVSRAIEACTRGLQSCREVMLENQLRFLRLSAWVVMKSVTPARAEEGKRTAREDFERLRVISPEAMKAMPDPFAEEQR